jgi:hypothetical protein
MCPPPPPPPLSGVRRASVMSLPADSSGVRRGLATATNSSPPISGPHTSCASCRSLGHTSGWRRKGGDRGQSTGQAYSNGCTALKSRWSGMQVL